MSETQPPQTSSSLLPAIALVLKLSFRSLSRNPRRTLITTASIGIGLVLALFFVSIGTGVYAKAARAATRTQAGNLAVQHPLYLQDPSPQHTVLIAPVRAAAASFSEVEVIKPILFGQAVVATGAGSQGVGMMGVDPAAEALTSPVAQKVIKGRYLQEGDTKGLMMGVALARQLKVEPGKKVVLTTSDLKGELVSELLRVTGIFQTGSDEADAFLIQVPLPIARTALGLPDGSAHQVGMVLTDPSTQADVFARLKDRVTTPTTSLVPWQVLIPQVAEWIELDHRINLVQRGFILFLVSFTILNTILMSVLERTREFAVLLALGTSPRLLRAQILMESVLLALLGTAVGMALGVPLCLWLEWEGFDASPWLPDGITIGGFFLDPIIKGDLTVPDLLFHAAVVLITTVIIGLYPMMRSTRVRLADTLRSR